MNDQSKDHWRRKLHAYLHDTPDKATDIANHEFRSGWIKAIDQFTEAENFDKAADWAASAADRLPFPSPARMRQPFENLDEIHHPLGGASIDAPTFKSSTEAFEASFKTRPFLLNNDDPRAAFLCVWRFWRNWASSADSRFPFLPADTRIPDHTIWHHLSVTSAFEGCRIPSRPRGSGKQIFCEQQQNPRLLLFSIGPVQDFISAARSTRDLWSGSYLLSYLVSTVLGKIALQLGPDHVFFPNLLDQPLLDLQLKDVFKEHSFSGKSIWKALDYTGLHLPKLLTPSLPNRFLALLPATLDDGQSAEDYAASLSGDLKDSLGEIAQTVKDAVKKLNLPFNETRFDAQVDRMLEIHWQTLAIPESFEDLWKQADQLLPEDEINHENGFQPRAAIKAIREMMESDQCQPQYPPAPTTGWGLLVSLIQWLHDGTKSHRQFEAWSTGQWQSGKDFNKDALNGKEEVVLTLPRDTKDAEKLGPELGLSKGTFKSNELLGASTLIKRIWWATFLPNQIGISLGLLKKAHPMPNTHAIAMGEPFSDSDEFDEVEGEKYFAILALDGDEMGKWVSGSKSTEMAHCLSPQAKAFYQNKAPGFLDAQRAITPSWHLQFSEALGNFSFHCAQRIVEAFDGRLLYAGGDDVLAMLPAKDALSCARALRAAFRGEKEHLNEVKGIIEETRAGKESDRKTRLFNLENDGYLKLHEDSGVVFGERRGILEDPVEFAALLPGPRTDVSIGIAIAHQKSPLQDVVRAAQAAEKRAKNQLGRAAVALTILKRSGEILEWGCKWSADHKKEEDSAGFRLLQALMIDLNERDLNRRFPHKLEAFLSPYLAPSKSIEDDKSFQTHFADILKCEVRHVLERDRGGFETGPDLFERSWQELEQLTKEGKAIPFSEKLQLLINLLRTAAWSSKNKTT